MEELAREYTREELAKILDEHPHKNFVKIMRVFD